MEFLKRKNDNGLKIKISLQRVMELQQVKILRVSNLYAISKIICKKRAILITRLLISGRLHNQLEHYVIKTVLYFVIFFNTIPVPLTTARKGSSAI